MRLPVASAALAAALVLTPVAAGYAPALSQDFSITNQVQPAIAGHPDLMPQLQVWWNAHAYYPRHAANNDESGTVKVHLVILPDGRIWTVDLVASSGSLSIDSAAFAVFREGFVRPFPQGEQQANVDVSLHYVLAHRHDQPVPVGYTPTASKRPFTITNDPIRSPILETMLQKTCTGTMVLGGIANHPIYGMHSWAQAIFFRKPDGTPWVKFFERGNPSISPVTEVGRMLTWTGREEHIGHGDTQWMQYTVWPDGENHLSGAIGSRMVSKFGVAYNANLSGNSVDLTCTTEVLPAVAYNDFLAESVTQSPFDLAPSDPP